MWITGTYDTLHELKITGKELLQKYFNTMCSDTAHTCFHAEDPDENKCFPL